MITYKYKTIEKQSITINNTNQIHNKKSIKKIK